MSEQQGKGRRSFLIGAGGVAAAAGAWLIGDRLGAGTGAEAQEALSPEAIRKAALSKYKTLGKTGLKISKVGIGTASTTSPAVLDRAIDLGMNYVDTAHMYGNGESEKAVGKVMKARRKEVVLTTKFSPRARTKAELTRSLDESLTRLQCDHVDCVLVHAVEEVDRIDNAEVFEVFEAARKAGKVSHLGFSGHGPKLQEVLERGIALGRYELVLIKFSFMDYPRLAPLLDKMHEKGIGVTAMKTRDGARHVDLEKFQRGDGFVGATLRWASTHPRVASAVLTMKTFDDADLFSKIAGQELAARDVEMLEQYAALNDKVQCRWCGDCGPACPSEVKVWDVDRAAMYYGRYGEERRGMELYASMGNPAQACVGCSAPCESACAYQIPIRAQMIEADGVLGWRPPDLPIDPATAPPNEGIVRGGDGGAGEGAEGGMADRGGRRAPFPWSGVLKG